MPQLKPPIIIGSGSGYGSNTGNTPVLPYAITSAVGDGITNAQPQLQADIDYCIANGIAALFIPKGNYKIFSPLLISKTSSGNYAQCTLHIFGTSSMWDSGNATLIEATFRNTFLLGIQMGKGCRISGINFRGLFSMAAMTDYEFYTKLFADYTDGLSRDSVFSPYSGIVIDPFTNSASQVPADGGYPGMTAYYKGSGSTTSGSTATIIEDCSITNVVVGICSSPNPYTRNAEITTIENVKFAYCKLCISGNQDQEKQNRIINIACWYDTHTIFATAVYGAGTHGNWNIDGVNLAGRVNRFILNTQGSYFPSSINRVYAETLGEFGLMHTNLACKVSNSSFDFVLPEVSGYKDAYIIGSGIEFDSCVFRHYQGGTPYPVPINADYCVFRNCNFSGLPLQVSYFGGLGKIAIFIDCKVNSYMFGLSQVKQMYKGEIRTMHTYGNWTLEDADMASRGDAHSLVKNVSHETYARINETVPYTLTVVNRSFTFTTSKANWYNLKSAVLIIGDTLSRVGYGLVTAKSGNDVTVSYCTSAIVNGSYYMAVFHPVYFATFMGDITSGSNQITNVKAGWLNVSVGMVFKNSYGTDPWIKIMAISGTTYTIEGNINVTRTAAYFGQNTTQEAYTDLPTTSIIAKMANQIVRKGDKLRQGGNADNAVEYTVTQTGIINPTDGDTRVAAWI